jgi:hypothetical protein
MVFFGNGATNAVQNAVPRCAVAEGNLNVPRQRLISVSNGEEHKNISLRKAPALEA